MLRSVQTDDIMHGPLLFQDESLREGRRGLGGPAACTWEGRHRTEMGVQFVCPIPECRYAMRLMNLSRWSTRNKAVTEAVTALRRMVLERQVCVCVCVCVSVCVVCMCVCV